MILETGRFIKAKQLYLMVQKSIQHPKGSQSDRSTRIVTDNQRNLQCKILDRIPEINASTGI